MNKALKNYFKSYIFLNNTKTYSQFIFISVYEKTTYTEKLDIFSVVFLSSVVQLNIK